MLDVDGSHLAFGLQINMGKAKGEGTPGSGTKDWHPNLYVLGRDPQVRTRAVLGRTQDT